MRRTILNLLVHPGERSTRPSRKPPASVEGQRRVLSPRADASASQPHSLIAGSVGCVVWQRQSGVQGAALEGAHQLMLPDSGSLGGGGGGPSPGCHVAVQKQEEVTSS